jgi:hypothetical protein
MLSALEQRGRTRVQPPLLRLEITANPTVVPLFLLRKITRRIQVLTHRRRWRSPIKTGIIIFLFSDSARDKEEDDFPSLSSPTRVGGDV